jgi:hypothetical protein
MHRHVYTLEEVVTLKTPAEDKFKMRPSKATCNRLRRINPYNAVFAALMQNLMHLVAAVAVTLLNKFMAELVHELLKC